MTNAITGIDMMGSIGTNSHTGYFRFMLTILRAFLNLFSVGCSLFLFKRFIIVPKK